jgi:DNA modification methylase
MTDQTPRIMNEAHGDSWTLYNGDSAEILPGLPDRSVDLAVFSPPFSSTYTYSPSERDLGNVSDDRMFWDQFSFISRELLRVVRPGRLVAMHVANLPAYENTHGYSGRRDFRGDTIRHFEEAGFHYHSEITIQKAAQAQAIRTHSKGLLFVQLQRDSAAMWQAWADYIVVMRAPGKNDKPIPGVPADPSAAQLRRAQDRWITDAHPVWQELGGLGDEKQPPAHADLRRLWDEIRRSDMTFDEWWTANSPVWTSIRETDVLGAHEARESDDERHLCALQLPVIERCVRLWSAPGETVLSPFAGIGSEGVVSVQNGRRFVGCELKPGYWKVAARNIAAAEAQSLAPSLFDLADVTAGAA